MSSQSYLELLRCARRVSKRIDEAEDLLQSVLLAAVEAGRADISRRENRLWLIGALRRRALFEARSAVRRRRREALCAAAEDVLGRDGTFPAAFLAALPPRLRTTALLALAGHTRAEIAWLQRLSAPALRQRIADIRRRWRRSGGGAIEEAAGLNGTLAFGRLRRTLLAPVRREGAVLASHDPDGHLFVLSATSQNGGARQQGSVSKPDEG